MNIQQSNQTYLCNVYVHSTFILTGNLLTGTLGCGELHYVRFRVPEAFTDEMLRKYNCSEICKNLFDCYVDYLLGNMSNENTVFTRIIIGAMMKSNVKFQFKLLQYSHI